MRSTPALDTQGNIYAAGFTASSSIPTTANAFQKQYSNPGFSGPGTRNGFIVEVNSTGTQLIYGTYFGPQYFGTTIESIAAGPSGSVYFSGSTTATTFQPTPGAYLSTPSTGYLAKLTPGRKIWDSFSYLNIPSGGFTHIQLGNQPATVYVSFLGLNPANFGVLIPEKLRFVIVDLSTLGLVSSFSTAKASSADFNSWASSLATPRSTWLVGSCAPCTLDLGGLISTDAFQTNPQSSGESAVLVQVTELPTTISAVTNAASYVVGPISPGEVVTIRGTGIGPDSPVSLTLDRNGKVSTSLGGAQVVFGGVPAPLTYVSSTQINAVVPYEIQGLFNVVVQAKYLDQVSNSLSVTSIATAPALFTLNASGAGSGAILNEDYSTNSPGNPATRGGYVTLFLTGEGQTIPAGATGKVTTISSTPPLTPQPIAPVAVLINGQSANVAFNGEAPGVVSGVLQLNVQVPTTVPAGNVPMRVVIGGNSTQNGVTVSLK
jgi:uncharacterized protein (TIGR03437 family)